MLVVGLAGRDVASDPAAPLAHLGSELGLEGHLDGAVSRDELDVGVAALPPAERERVIAAKDKRKAELNG